MGYLDIGGRAGLAIVFLLAVGGKLIGRSAFAEFVRSVRQLTGLAGNRAMAAACLVVAGELATIALVVLPLRVAGVLGCLLALLLTSSFTIAVAVSINRGNQAPCRCFGRSNTPLGRRHLLRNGLLLLLGLVGLLGQLGNPAVPLAVGLTGAVAGLFVGLIIAGFDEIAQLLVPAG